MFLCMCRVFTPAVLQQGRVGAKYVSVLPILCSRLQPRTRIFTKRGPWDHARKRANMQDLRGSWRLPWPGPADIAHLAGFSMPVGFPSPAADPGRKFTQHDAHGHPIYLFIAFVGFCGSTIELATKHVCGSHRGFRDFHETERGGINA